MPESMSIAESVARRVVVACKPARMQLTTFFERCPRGDCAQVLWLSHAPLVGPLSPAADMPPPCRRSELCRGTKSLRDRGTVWRSLSVIPWTGIVDHERGALCRRIKLPLPGKRFFTGTYTYKPQQKAPLSSQVTVSLFWVYGRETGTFRGCREPGIEEFWYGLSYRGQLLQPLGPRVGRLYCPVAGTLGQWRLS
jgi:hypothetical protein